MTGCQNSEDDTLPCTNSTAWPLRPVTDSTATVSRSVGTRSAVTPGSSVFIRPPLWRGQGLHTPVLGSVLAGAAELPAVPRYVERPRTGKEALLVLERPQRRPDPERGCVGAHLADRFQLGAPGPGARPAVQPFAAHDRDSGSSSQIVKVSGSQVLTSMAVGQQEALSGVPVDELEPARGDAARDRLVRGLELPDLDGLRGPVRAARTGPARARRRPVAPTAPARSRRSAPSARPAPATAGYLAAVPRASPSASARMCPGPVPQHPPMSRAPWPAQVIACWRYSPGVRPSKTQFGGCQSPVSA